MDDTNKPDQQAAAMAIPLTCPNDGSVLVEGTKFGYNAWLCPMCNYWKLRTVAPS